MDSTVTPIHAELVAPLGTVLAEDFKHGRTAIELREHGVIWVYSLEQRPPKHVVQIDPTGEVLYPEGHPKHVDQQIPF